MEVSMAVLTGRQLGAREASHAVLAMHADALFCNDFAVAGGAIDRVESSPVPPVIGADVALEALCVAVRRAGEVTEVVVTFQAGAGFFGYADPGEQGETERENCEGGAHDRVPGD